MWTLHKPEEFKLENKPGVNQEQEELQLQEALTVVMEDIDSVERLLSLWFERVWGILLCRLVTRMQEDRAWVITISQFIVYYFYQSVIARRKTQIHDQIKGWKGESTL